MSEFALPPPLPPNPDCHPPPLPSYPECEDPGLTGARLPHPRKLVLMTLFSFEADTLEIMLKEQQDLVDFIFIVEASTTHRGVPKPLMWERLKMTPRFSFVTSSQVIHIIVDTAGGRAGGDVWYYEKLQTSEGVSRILSWAKTTGQLGESDLFISADVDEVMSRAALQKLRWCSVNSPVITGALWMPVGALDRALKSDYPVEGRPHTYGLPTIYQWGHILRGRGDGSRLQVHFRGARDKYVEGGIHMTNSAFFPIAVLKEITGTEYTRNISGFFNTIFADVSDIDYQQDMITTLDSKPFWKNTTVPLDQAPDVTPYVPWFLACNRQRFPYWFGHPDPRNYHLLLAMRSEGGKKEGQGSDGQRVW